MSFRDTRIPRASIGSSAVHERRHKRAHDVRARLAINSEAKWSQIILTPFPRVPCPRESSDSTPSHCCYFHGEREREREKVIVNDPTLVPNNFFLQGDPKRSLRQISFSSLKLSDDFIHFFWTISLCISRRRKKSRGRFDEEEGKRKFRGWKNLSHTLTDRQRCLEPTLFFRLSRWLGAIGKSGISFWYTAESSRFFSFFRISNLWTEAGTTPKALPGNAQRRLMTWSQPHQQVRVKVEGV